MPGILEEAMIPTIDLTGLGTPGCADHGRIAAQLLDIYSTVGFAYLSNHGVDEAVVEAAFEASRQFHALPLASKMAIEVNEYHRGYIPINTSTTTTSSVATVTKPNQSASLDADARGLTRQRARTIWCTAGGTQPMAVSLTGDRTRLFWPMYVR